MDETALVESDIIRGEELIGVLDKAEFPVSTALWLYASDRYAQWRLVIATPLVDDQGPLGAYKKLDKIVRKDLPNLVLFLQQVQLVSPSDSLIQSLKKTYRLGKGIFDPSFPGTTESTHAGQAHLYRVNE